MMKDRMKTPGHGKWSRRALMAGSTALVAAAATNAVDPAMSERRDHLPGPGVFMRSFIICLSSSP